MSGATPPRPGVRPAGPRPAPWLECGHRHEAGGGCLSPLESEPPRRAWAWGADVSESPGCPSRGCPALHLATAPSVAEREARPWPRSSVWLLRGARSSDTGVRSADAPAERSIPGRRRVRVAPRGPRGGRAPHRQLLLSRVRPGLSRPESGPLHSRLPPLLRQEGLCVAKPRLTHFGDSPGPRLPPEPVILVSDVGLSGWPSGLRLLAGCPMRSPTRTECSPPQAAPCTEVSVRGALAAPGAQRRVRAAWRAQGPGPTAGG